MGRYRFVYAITLITAVIFYISYRPWFSWYLLVLVLLLIPFDLLISLPGMFGITMKLSAPEMLEQNAIGLLTISTAKKNSLPVRGLFVKLRVLGDDFATDCMVLCPAHDSDGHEITIDSSQAGLTVFIIKQVRAVSLIGLFSLRVRTAGRAAVLVLPLAQKPKGIAEPLQGVALVPKPGGGFSEEHDIRAYHPGDSIRNIHWKLSAKLDMPVIREPLIPPQQSRLVHITPWETAAEREASLSHLRWVCEYLLNMGLTFYIKFGDRQYITEVSSEADLVNFLRRILDKSSIMKTAVFPRITRFSWVYKVGS